MARVAISNVEIFDGEKVLPGRSSVHIAGEKIVGVGATPVGFEADEQIDGGGMTLMPGMISSHFHAEYDIKVATYFNQPVGTENPPGVAMLIAANSMRNALMSGYTGVISGACSYEIDQQLKMAMNEGILEGPRIIPCSKGLDSISHGYNDTAPWWKKMEAVGSYLWCSGPDEFRRAVREEVRKGAELIKIFPTTGHGGEEPHEIKGLMDDELQATVEAAHQRNVKVRAHVCYKEDMMKCIEYGVDIIDHGDEVDDDVIEAMLKHGTWFVPSMWLLQTFQDNGGATNINNLFELNETPKEAAWRRILENVKKASDAGVKMLAGDDYGLETTPHKPGEYSKELAFYVRKVGIEPAEVLKWATRNGAELMGTNAGIIAQDKVADLILVNGRPTENIELLIDVDNIKMIMLGGKQVKNTLNAQGAASQSPQLASSSI
jgi:imidazolonepropionase-like amidohydrolase